ncbi:MAG: DUF202 domain-containing protein [Aeromicrobium sp.]
MSDADASSSDGGLQAERTTMAWVRTALAVEATAVLAVRAMRAETAALALLAVTSACLAGFMLTALPRLHARRIAVMHDDTIPIVAPCVLAGLVIVLCLVSAGFIALDR